jgi:hypothetical protein
MIAVIVIPFGCFAGKSRLPVWNSNALAPHGLYWPGVSQSREVSLF